MGKQKQAIINLMEQYNKNSNSRNLKFIGVNGKTISDSLLTDKVVFHDNHGLHTVIWDKDNKFIMEKKGIFGVQPIKRGEQTEFIPGAYYCKEVSAEELINLIDKKVLW